MKHAGVVHWSFAGLVIWLLTAVAPDSNLRARSLTIEDAEGRARIKLSCSADVPTIEILTPGGGVGIRLCVRQQGTIRGSLSRVEVRDPESGGVVAISSSSTLDETVRSIVLGRQESSDGAV